MSKTIDDHQDLPAGQFSTWLQRIRSALIHDEGMEVPCESCNACCRSSQFIHIKPEEKETIDRIPGQLLFAAPRMPQGHVVMGYGEKGQCPMFIDDECSIYAYRPLTCRIYDCRIFPATGIDVDDDEKVLIAQHVRRWKFNFSSESDHDMHAALLDAAKFLREHSEMIPGGMMPCNAMQLAILAIQVVDVFLKINIESEKTDCITSSPEVSKAVMGAIERAGARRH